MITVMRKKFWLDLTQNQKQCKYSNRREILKQNDSLKNFGNQQQEKFGPVNYLHAKRHSFASTSNKNKIYIFDNLKAKKSTEREINKPNLERKNKKDSNISKNLLLKKIQ